MKLSYVSQVMHASCVDYKGFCALIEFSEEGWVEVLMLHEEPGDKVAGPFCTAAPLPSLTPLLTWKKAPSITSSWSIHLASYHYPRQR